MVATVNKFDIRDGLRLPDPAGGHGRALAVALQDDERLFVDLQGKYSARADESRPKGHPFRPGTFL